MILENDFSFKIAVDPPQINKAKEPRESRWFLLLQTCSLTITYVFSFDFINSY